MTTTFDCGDPIAARRIAYAEALLADGEAVSAAELMVQALERMPQFAAGWLRLGEMHEAAGATAAAGDAYREALRLDAAGGLGAEMKLARLGALPVPDAAPAAFVANLFDQYAPRFEVSLVGKLGYRAPERLIAAIERTAGPSARFASVLDIGCGTGLMGERLRGRASRLAGLDISEGMLAVAARKTIYDSLICADLFALAAFADPAVPGTHDCISAADVFIYCGDLAPVFAALSAELAPGGIAAFSLERHEGPEPFVLRDSLRYAHSEGSVHALLEAAGLDRVDTSRAFLREDRGAPIEGLFVVARRPVARVTPASASSILSGLADLPDSAPANPSLN